MSDLIPAGLPSGQSILEEGRQLGQKISLGRSAFAREKNVRSITDYRQARAEQGLITWHMVIGLPTVEETASGLKEIYDWGRQSGTSIDIAQVIPDTRMGLPEDLWDKAPKGSSFMFSGPEDYVKLAQAAPIQLMCSDSHIGSPASVRNATNALKAGCGMVGNLAQFVYNYPYFADEAAQVTETVKAIGIMADKKKDGIVLHSYSSSGIPGLLLDYASLVGYARFEKYVVEELCGAAYSVGFGGLTDSVPVKIAVWLALHDILKGDHPEVTYVYGNTIGVTEHAGSNYLITAAELIPFIVAERKYRTAAAMLPMPVKEKVRVPTKDEIVDIFQVGEMAKSRAADYEKMLDFTYINQLRSLLVQRGNQFYDNIRRGLMKLGVDIQDPVQALYALRRLGAARLEEMFHPGERNAAMPNSISPFVATELMSMSIQSRDEALNKIREKKLGDVVRGKKIVIGSTDWHSFALFVLGSVFSELGAQVINGGIDLDAEEVLALAQKEGTPYIVLTTHNGLCLDYGTHLMELAAQAQQSVRVFMGGRLHAILKGQKEAVDVSDRLQKLGITPCNDMSLLLEKMAGIQ